MHAGALLFDSRQKPSPGWVNVGWGMVIFLLLSFFCAVVMGGAEGFSRKGWDAVEQYRDVFLKGWWLTIVISLASLIISSLMGLAIALSRLSGMIPLRLGALLYIEVVRGTPLIVQILFLFYVVANAIGMENRLIAGVLILSLFSAAYLAEMIRGGIESIPASQLESARAIGLTPVQIYRFVIAPQALRQILPALAGQFASLIKDSSLLSIIGVAEFTLAAQQVNSATYRTLESYLPLAVGYLVLTLPISLIAKVLENRLRYET
jgi:polar amino acid transport system permease protein